MILAWSKVKRPGFLAGMSLVVSAKRDASWSSRTTSMCATDSTQGLGVGSFLSGLSRPPQRPLMGSGPAPWVFAYRPALGASDGYC